MKFIDITPHYFFDEAMTLYGQTFPYEIRESEDVFLNSLRMGSERYHFVGIKIDDRLAAFITFHIEKDHHVGFIVYLVVHPDFRGQKLAAKLIAYAEARMLTVDGRLETVVLECEKDAFGSSPLESFYNKFDYHCYPIFYMQPGLHGDAPVPMNLFIKQLHDSSTIFLAITQIYIAKYNEANGISLTTLQDYISRM